MKSPVQPYLRFSQQPNPISQMGFVLFYLQRHIIYGKKDATKLIFAVKLS